MEANTIASGSLFAPLTTAASLRSPPHGDCSLPCRLTGALPRKDRNDAVTVTQTGFGYFAAYCGAAGKGCFQSRWDWGREGIRR